MKSIRRIKADTGIFTVILMLLCTLSVSAGAGSEPQPTGKFRKIVVYAKIEQANLKKQLEEDVAGQLKSKGYEAVTAGSIVTDEDLGNMEALVNKLEALGVDAVLAYTVSNVETRVSNTPTVNASVGVPVRIGFMNVFVGGSVPLGGGQNLQKIVHVKAGFYSDKTSPDPAFAMDLTGNLDNGTDALIRNFAKKSVKSLIKSGLL